MVLFIPFVARSAQKIVLTWGNELDGADINHVQRELETPHVYISFDAESDENLGKMCACRSGGLFVSQRPLASASNLH